MCEYVAGNDEHDWASDCAATAAFRAAAVSALPGGACEAGLQAVVDDVAAACDTVANSWSTVRCVATEDATVAQKAACDVVAAPTGSASCPTECTYLDPSALKAVWEGWGCVAGTVEKPICSSDCQAKINHYYHECAELEIWDRMKPENKRLVELIGCGSASVRRPSAWLLLAAAAATTSIAAFL